MADDGYFVDPKTGDRVSVGGCLLSNEPSDLPKFGASQTLSSAELPSSVDLRQSCTPVENQGSLNSCVGNALAGAYEFLIMKNSKKHIDVSRLFIYYNGRRKDGLQDYNMADKGTYIRSAIAGLAEFGCCKEDGFPYNPAYVNQKPPPNSFSEANHHRIAQAMNVRVDLNEMKACLAEGYPFAFGILTYQTFMNAGANGGRVQTPNPYYESQNSQHGAHAMLAVGYSDASRCFIVRNSWGPNWGDKGYCYIPYDYMCNPQLCQDLHAIKTVSDDDSRRHRTERNVPNPYNWNADKDKKHYIPPNYHYPDFDFKYFWKVNDTFDYFNSLWQNGKAIPFVWKTSQSEAGNDCSDGTVSSKTESKLSYIVWIDQKSDENIRIEKQLTSDKSIKIDFYETLSQAENHLSRYINQIKSSSTFQIICRGYYEHENKNPLNLLEFLNKHQLEHIPVIVFTQHKSGLQNHLQNQSSSMGINDWRQRLFITSNSEELIRKSKENIARKSDSDSHRKTSRDTNE